MVQKYFVIAAIAALYLRCINTFKPLNNKFQAFVSLLLLLDFFVSLPPSSLLQFASKNFSFMMGRLFINIRLLLNELNKLIWNPQKACV